MATKSNFLIGTILLIVIAFYAWGKRNVEVNIADVSFRFPAKAVMSLSDAGAMDGLDRNTGAFIVLPNGPYHGNWGLLLQSSKDRHGDGMPSGLKDGLREGSLRFSETAFGWLDCVQSCGQERWYFRRLPNKNDSTYSVGTLVCFDTDICKLFLSYRDVDVQVSLERKQIGEVPKVLIQVAGVLEKYDTTAKSIRKMK